MPARNAGGPERAIPMASSVFVGYLPRSEFPIHGLPGEPERV
jgi:hypothetical protein